MEQWSNRFSMPFTGSPEKTEKKIREIGVRKIGATNFTYFLALFGDEIGKIGSTAIII